MGSIGDCAKEEVAGEFLGAHSVEVVSFLVEPSRRDEQANRAVEVRAGERKETFRDAGEGEEIGLSKDVGYSGNLMEKL